MTSSFWRMAAASLFLGATLGQAATLYTFSNTGASPYSFSFLELSPLTSTGSFAIPPFQVGGLTFTQASLTQTAGTDCFQFGTAGATLTATQFSCGLSAFAPAGGWQSLFFGVAGPGTYAAFNATSNGSAPPAPNQLTIQNVPAFEYTFSNNGANPYSFSFLEPSLLNATGPFAIAPFQMGGLTFTQASLTHAGGTSCFQFGTAGASLTATQSSCGLSAFPPEGGWQSLFFGATGPGTYAAFNAASGGNAPAAPNGLTITELPEPASWALFAGGALILAAFARKRKKTAVIVAVGFTTLAVGLSIPASAATLYNFTSFNGPGNNAGGTTVNAIANNGDVVGFSSDNPANPTLFTNFIRSANGTVSPLATGGDPLAMANGINASGTVVGMTSAGTAFELTAGTLTTLPKVNTTTASETAFGINDAGLIVGQFTDNATDTTPGFLFNGAAFTILNPVASAIVTNAQGINNNGLVTGFYSVDGVHQHGFFYDSTTGQFTLPPDPNVPNLVLTQFLGINDGGLAVGYYQLPDGSQHGFLFDTAAHSYSFLDEPNAAVNGFSITQITGVNDAGEIAGFYVDAATGVQRGFFATPAAAATPEPGTFALLLGALAPMLAARRWRRSA